MSNGVATRSEGVSIQFIILGIAIVMLAVLAGGPVAALLRMAKIPVNP